MQKKNELNPAPCATLTGPGRFPGTSDKGLRLSPSWAVLLASLFLLVFFTSGCGPKPVVRDDLAAETPLIWPGPPSPSRIVYLRSISRPEDIGVQKGIFRRVVEFILGSSFNNMIKPYGVATDSSGRVIVADTAFKRVHIYDIKEKKYTYIDRPGDLEFVSPIGVAVDGEDRIYVSDSGAGKVFVFDRKGRYRSHIDGGKRPTGIAINTGLGYLYVVDTPSHHINVFDLEGKMIRTVGSWGAGPGEFNYPVDIFIDRIGEVYVTDTMNYRVQTFDARGRYISSFGTHGDGTGDFGRPKGVAVDVDGNIYIADALFDTVQIFSRKGEFLLNFGRIGNGRGMFWMPGGMYIDGGDRIYVADAYNSRVQIFEYLGDSEQVQGLNNAVQEPLSGAGGF